MSMRLVTERLTLRLLELGDAEAIERLASEKEVADTTMNIPHPYPLGSAAGFIQSRHEAAMHGDGYSFAVTLTEGGTFLGIVGLNIDKRNNKADLGYWIGRAYWGQGYCTEAAARVVQYAFEQLKLNKVFAAALTRNPASSRVMEKIGMKFEGILREHLCKEGQYEDVKCYGLLRGEVQNTRL